MEFERLAGKVPDSKELKRRVEHVRQIIVHHPKYENLLEELETLLNLSEGSVSPDGLFIIGPTGAGKSTVTKEFTARYPREIKETDDRVYTHIPVLRVVVPPKATPRMLASKILEDMGDPFSHKGSESELTSRIHHFAKELGIKGFIFDEFQHLIDADTEYVLATASNWVKTFTEEIGIAVILCGMPESVKVFISNPQLDRRFCNKVALEAFAYGTVEEILTFRVFLQKVDKMLPFAELANLADPRMADKLYFISMGIPFYVMKLLEYATYIAAKAGADKITEAHLEKALMKVKQVARPFVANPFADPNFDLEAALGTENDAMNKYKEKLMIKRKKGRNSQKAQGPSLNV
ncbi:TniB family NTP-binding protein [Paenibacillus roseipurpureus]|uniref:TniB family NTP-binding protein n=1 Tax=Paenibacillus roseopurpureus TaxID=2918901 RepID=A0AA96LKZ3_9BACL|nr:TniB family NTP-binding protein [Paenibacillus sp. MBLB1832]WNR43006.1 TniB family NTP-binding protein [Paenibacillus sp. MBLB1832]